MRALTYKGTRYLLLISGGTFLLFTILLYLLPGKQHLYVDENTHYDQIVAFYRHHFKQDDRLTTLPGYHALFTLIAITFHTVNITFFRFVSVIIALITIIFFAKLDAKINGSINLVKIGAFALFPLMFPFYFMIYTDILSLLLFIAALYFGLKKHYQLFALLGILNLAVRQNTFFWYIFSFLLVFISHYPGFTIKDIGLYLKKSWLFLIGILLFVVFVWINKGVAVGDKSMHPSNSIHFGNVFYFLFLLGVFIFPFTFRRSQNISTKRLIIIALLFILYWTCFEVTHPYNKFAEGFFLRNALLHYSMTSMLAKALFFIPMIGGIVVLFQFYATNKPVLLLYVIFGALSLLPSWLIEQRYYFIHFALLLLYGINENMLKSQRIIYMYAAMSFFLLYGVFTGYFFI